MKLSELENEQHTMSVKLLTDHTRMVHDHQAKALEAFVQELATMANSLLVLMDGITPSREVVVDPQSSRLKHTVEQLLRQTVADSMKEVTETKHDIKVRSSTQSITPAITAQKNGGGGVRLVVTDNVHAKPMIRTHSSHHNKVKHAVAGNMRRQSYQWAQLPLTVIAEVLQPFSTTSFSKLSHGNNYKRSPEMKRSSRTSTSRTGASLSSIPEVLKVPTTMKITQAHEMVMRSRDEEFEVCMYIQSSA